MKILSDVNQKNGKHNTKERYFAEQGVEVITCPLPVGDYVLVNDKVQDVLDRKEKRGIPVKKMDLLGTYTVSIDTKRDIQELIGDICGKDHDRFRDECILAQNNGIKLYIVVENKEETIKQTGVVNKTIRNLDDLHKWVNPRLFIMKRGVDGKRVQKYPTATRGITLQKACYTIENKYGCKFLFCHPNESAQMILNLLVQNR